MPAEIPLIFDRTVRIPIESDRLSSASEQLVNRPALIGEVTDSPMSIPILNGLARPPMLVRIAPAFIVLVRIQPNKRSTFARCDSKCSGCRCV